MIAKRKPSVKTKSILILECDAEKLASQSLSMSEEIEQIARMFALNADVEVVKATTEEHLLSSFARLSENKRYFNIVVVIGHSNSSDLVLTSDRVVGWNVFAKWIDIFLPKKLLFIACKSGNFSVAEEVFGQIKTLKEIYAPPIDTTKRQSKVMKILIPILLNGKSLNQDEIFLGQIVNLIITGGITWHWTKRKLRKYEI